ncbi:MAG: hypothetical protein Q8R02_14070 [Hyphomonadaceae bacterium]|nr:hypothetical protein [Hyphomonadaceae bacterium]
MDQSVMLTIQADQLVFVRMQHRGSTRLRLSGYTGEEEIDKNRIFERQSAVCWGLRWRTPVRADRKTQSARSVGATSIALPRRDHKFLTRQFERYPSSATAP